MERSPAFLAIPLLVLSIAGTFAVYDFSQTNPKEVVEAQQIKVKTELMEVRAVVMDKKGQIVENLKKEDFELLENDKPQEISFFSLSQIESERSQPVTGRTGTRDKAPAAQNSPVGNSQNEATPPKTTRERLSEAPVRTTLLYVDNQNLSFISLNRVKQALRRFVKERLTEQDLVAIATSSQTLGVAQQFTRDRQMLNYAIEQIRLGPALRNAVIPPVLAAGVIADRLDSVRMGVELMRRETGTECGCDNLRTLARNQALMSLSDAAYSRKAMLATIEQFAQQMVEMPGKRMIVIFSDGFTMYDVDTGEHNDQLQPAIDRAVRSGIVVYTIDAKGLQAPPTIDVTKNRARTDPGTYNRLPGDYSSEADFQGKNPSAFAEWKTESDSCKEAPYCKKVDPNYCEPRCFVPDMSQWSIIVSWAEREEQNGLYAIADQTGGKMYTNHNDLDVPLGQAFDANRFYYVLSYYLPPGNQDLKFRALKVRVRNHPEYTVRTARGFSIPDATAKLESDAGKTPQQLLIDAMRKALPITDLSVSARADFVETEADDKQVSLTVYFDGDRFQYKQQNQRNVVELELIYAIYDSSGKQVEGISAQVEGSLTGERMSQAKTSGFRFSRRLMIKPGVYQARIGVREEGTNRIGTATAWVEVPQLASEKLEMSDLRLRNPLDTDEKEGIDVSELEQVKMVRGIPLYAKSDFCDYSFRVHRGTLVSAGSSLELMKELLQGGKAIRQEPWRPMSAEEQEVDKKGWFDVNGDVDFSEFNPGIYELRISIKDPKANKTVQRTAVFSLE